VANPVEHMPTIHNGCAAKRRKWRGANCPVHVAGKTGQQTGSSTIIAPGYLSHFNRTPPMWRRRGCKPSPR
jgi:hypothetical protein